MQRYLRNNPTEAEARLWQALRRKQVEGARFRRQHRLGLYVVDFICLDQKLIVEVDGGQHAGSAHDQLRDRWLKAEGFTVLRFWNNEILGNLEGCVFTIAQWLRTQPPPP